METTIAMAITLMLAMTIMVVTVAACIQKIGELTGEALPSDADELKEFMQRKHTDKIVH